MPTETYDSERARGRAAREVAPRRTYAEWQPAAGRPDAVSVLSGQDVARVPELVPIRHGRMSTSAFAFYRGGAAVMAGDLAAWPSSGLLVQCCGDAHLSNFGTFASPERQLLFDLNDFDETAVAPFEWDIARLAASIIVAADDSGIRRPDAGDAVRACVESYRSAMREFADRPFLDTWYARLAVEEVAATLAAQGRAKAARRTRDHAVKARARTSLRALAKLATEVDGELRIVDRPPLVFSLRSIADRVDVAALTEGIRKSFAQYLASLPPSMAHVVSQYRVVDIGRKVVGVGSVGLRAWIVLLQDRSVGDPLFLQLKEAQPSVLGVHGDPPPAHNGERVVLGQRMMQAASDPFLGWSTSSFDDFQYYWRQLWDMKGSADIGTMTARDLGLYARICGWTLARAHARSGSAMAIAAYLGRGPAFVDAMVEFAYRYAAQNAADFAGHAQAIADGIIEARSDL